MVSSTGSANTTTGFGIYTDTGITLAPGTTSSDVTGTNAIELDYELSDAGTYYIGYTETGRNGRILSVEVSYI